MTTHVAHRRYICHERLVRHFYHQIPHQSFGVTNTTFFSHVKNNQKISSPTCFITKSRVQQKLLIFVTFSKHQVTSGSIYISETYYGIQRENTNDCLTQNYVSLETKYLYRRELPSERRTRLKTTMSLSNNKLCLRNRNKFLASPTTSFSLLRI